MLASPGRSQIIRPISRRHAWLFPDQSRSKRGEGSAAVALRRAELSMTSLGPE
jgi:hypothetical protein